MKLKIDWMYKTKTGAKTLLTSDFMSVHEALLFYEDIMKTGRVHSIEMIDTYNTEWLPKEMKKYIKEMETEPHNVSIYFDAGFEIESRLAGLGVVIYFEQNGMKYRIRQNARVHSLLSNNEAEYAALHLACNVLRELDVRGQEIEVFGDSQVVVSQMAGDWPVYEEELSNWADKIDAEMSSMKLTPIYTHVGRKQNSEAHRLATQAIEGVDISSKMKV